MVRPDADVGFTERHFKKLLSFHQDARLARSTEGV